MGLSFSPFKIYYLIVNDRIFKLFFASDNFYGISMELLSRNIKFKRTRIFWGS
jgi:hypothetical protein